MDSLTFLSNVVATTSWPLATVVIVFLVKPMAPAFGRGFREWVQQRNIQFRSKAFGAEASIQADLIKQQADASPPEALDASVGKEAEAVPAAQIDDSKKLGPMPPPPPPPPPLRPAAAARYNEVLEEIKVVDVDKRVDVLARRLAETRADWFNEWIYNRVLGSQITLLEQANFEIPISQAYSIYQQAVAQFPHLYGEYKFEQWLGFLTAHQLIAQTGDKISRATYGSDFLVYMIANKLTRNRFG